MKPWLAMLQDAQNNPPGMAKLIEAVAVAAGGGLSVALFGLFLGWLTSLVTSHFTLQTLLETTPTTGESLRRLRARLGTTVKAFVLSTLWTMGMMVALSLPGVALAVLGAVVLRQVVGGIAAALLGTLAMMSGLLFCLLWYVLRFMLVPQLLAAEDRDGWATLRRAGQLIGGRIGPGLAGLVKLRATVVLSVVILLLLTVSSITNVPVLVIHWLFRDPSLPLELALNNTPEHILVPFELAQVCAQTLFISLGAIASSLFYLDMRMRREGLDLELKLAALSRPERP
jgi:hypothetical protein